MSDSVKVCEFVLVLLLPLQQLLPVLVVGTWVGRGNRLNRGGIEGLGEVQGKEDEDL